MKLRTLILLGLGLALLACQSPLTDSGNDSGVGEGNVTMVPVDFSLSVFDSEKGSTKADVGSITELISSNESPAFRGLSNIRLLAFDTGTTKLVQANSRSMVAAQKLSNITGEIDEEAFDGQEYHQGIVAGNHAHLYSGSEVSLPTGATSALVYATAPPIEFRFVSEPEKKHINGALIENNLSSGAGVIQAGDISFSPEPIETNGSATVVLQGIASIMNYLTQGITYSVDYHYNTNTEQGLEGTAAVSWASSQQEGIREDATLQSWFLEFTNNGKVQVIAGPNLEARLSSLYQKLTGDYTNVDNSPYLHPGTEYHTKLDNGDDLTYAYLYNGLKEAVLERFQDLFNTSNNNMKLVLDGDKVKPANETYRLFPDSFGLPNGAARLKWAGTQFELARYGLNGNIPIDRFCYMPPLYYYVNTNLSTSTDQRIYEKYKLDTWNQILSNYRLGKIVTEGTKAVALDNALQYACGTLAVTVQAATSTLPANSNTTGLANGTNFPVTGIILGGQFQQNFDFTPRNDDVEEGESLTEYFTYDNKVPSGMYLTVTESQRLITLSLPTTRETNVYFYVEFKNNSGHSFKGRDGIVEDGFKFYLAGVLDWQGLRDEGSSNFDISKNRVIMQDHCTVAHCRVSSLENAYLVIPTVGNPELQMGVQTQMNWYHSPGSYVVLD